MRGTFTSVPDPSLLEDLAERVVGRLGIAVGRGDPEGGDVPVHEVAQGGHEQRPVAGDLRQQVGLVLPAADDLPKFGNVSFLHMTDCHAQLKPIHFREAGYPETMAITPCGRLEVYSKVAGSAAFSPFTDIESPSSLPTASRRVVPLRHCVETPPLLQIP